LQNQLDSSKPSQIMMDEQQNYEIDPYKGEAALNKDVIKTTLPPTLGTPNPQGGLPVTQFGDIPTEELTPLQKLARAEAGNIDTRDFRFNPTGEQDKSLLQKWVEDGPGYQPTSDATIAEMEAMGNQVKTFADKASLIRNMGVEPDNLFDEHFDRNQAEYTPTLSDYHPDATPMQLAGSGSTLSGEQLNTRHPAYQAQLAREINEAENLFQNQDTGFPTETRGSFAGSSADLSATKDGPKTGPSGTTAIDANNKNLDKMIEQNNLPWRDRENTSLFSSFNPIDIALRLASGGDVTENAIAAHRANKEGDYGDGLKSYKDENLQKLDGSLYQPVSDATDGYHFRSGKDAGKLSGSQDLTLGGLPMAAGSWLYQQANGLLDGTVGSNANKQSIDNMQGLIASGNAPAVKTLFDNVAAGKVRDANIKKSTSDGTFKPGVKAPAKAAKEAEAAKSAKEKAAKAKAKSEAQAKAKASDIRSKAAAKAKAEAQAKAKAEAVKKEKEDTKARILKLEEAKEKAAQAKAKAEAQAKAKAEQARSKAAAKAKAEAQAKAKAKAEAEAKAKAKKAADEAARNARENARRPTPAPKTKAKPVRTPVKKSPSVTKTSKPSRTPTKKTTSKPNYGYTRTYSRRYGL